MVQIDNCFAQMSLKMVQIDKKLFWTNYVFLQILWNLSLKMVQIAETIH